MPTFLTRPVFNTAIDWATNPAHTFQYDLNEKLLGFAAPRFEQLQSDTVRGFEFTVSHFTEAEIVAFDTFTDQLKGRLNGFWIPSPYLKLTISPDSSSFTTMRILAQGLSFNFEDHASRYFVLSKLGETDVYVRCGSVDRQANNDELISFGETLAILIDDTWNCRELLYVRLASDVESGKYVTENIQQRTVRVIELPTEYANLETGEQVVYLYRFRGVVEGNTRYWNFTGLNEDIVSNAVTFKTYPIEHGSITRSMTPENDELDIKTWFAPDNPVSKFIPFTLDRPIYVTVYEAQYDSPDTVTVVWTGRVRSVSADGKQLTAKCVSAFLDRKYNRFLFQSNCNYHLYDENCQATEQSVQLLIEEISGIRVTLTASEAFLASTPDSKTMNWWALGTFSVLGQIRTILQNKEVYVFNGGHRIDVRLNSPLTTPINGITVDYQTNVVTEEAHNRADNSEVIFDGNVLPGGLSRGVTYFVRNPTTDTYTVATTSGGDPIDITNNGLAVTASTPDYFIGELATLKPGCDGSIEQCGTKKHNNRRRFGGHWPAPQSLSVQAVERQDSPNKK